MTKIVVWLGVHGNCILLLFFFFLFSRVLREWNYGSYYYYKCVDVKIAVGYWFENFSSNNGKKKIFLEYFLIILWISKSDKDTNKYNCRKGKVNENDGTKTILIKINSNIIRNCEIIIFLFFLREGRNFNYLLWIILIVNYNSLYFILFKKKKYKFLSEN